LREAALDQASQADRQVMLDEISRESLVMPQL
jgi:hypothetical protein